MSQITAIVIIFLSIVLNGISQTDSLIQNWAKSAINGQGLGSAMLPDSSIVKINTYLGQTGTYSTEVVRFSHQGDTIWSFESPGFFGATLTIDQEGNIVGVGYCAEGEFDIDLGQGIHNVMGGFTSMNSHWLPNEHVLFKWTPMGDLIWAKSFFSSDVGGILHQYVDANESGIYLNGIYAGSVDVDPSMVESLLVSTSDLGVNYFVLKFSFEGELLISKSYGSSSPGAGLGVRGIVVDESAVLISGEHYGVDFDFNPDPAEQSLNVIGEWGNYLLALDANLEFSWVSQSETKSWYSYSFASDNSIYLAGSVGVGFNATNIIISKFSQDGESLWEKVLPNESSIALAQPDLPFDIEIASNGDLYIIGKVQGGSDGFDLDPSEDVFTINAIPGEAGASIFIAVYDSIGNLKTGNFLFSALSTGGLLHITEGNHPMIYFSCDHKIIQFSNDCLIEPDYIILTDNGNAINPNGSIELSFNLSDLIYNWSNESIAPSISGLTEGLYYVYVVDSAGCYYENSFEISNIVNVAEPNQLSSTLWPNPIRATEKLNISIPNERIMKLELHSSSGVLVQQCYEINDVEISNLKSGVYFLHVFDKNRKSRVFRLVVY